MRLHRMSGTFARKRERLFETHQKIVILSEAQRSRRTGISIARAQMPITHPQKRRAATLASVRPVFRFSKIRFGTGPRRLVISVLPGTCEAVRPRLSRTNRYHRHHESSLGSIALHPASWALDSILLSGSSNLPCGLPDSPFSSSRIAPCLLSPSGALLPR
jgi:hypothetical protein